MSRSMAVELSFYHRLTISRVYFEKNKYGTQTVGRGDFQKNFRIFLGMNVSSWVIEIGWICIFPGLKKDFSPWHKFQFSSEHIYLRENIQDFDITHCIRYSIQKQRYQHFYVIELSIFCMMISINFTKMT